MAGYLRLEYRVCGKPGCACRQDRTKRHGPYWVLIWWEQGKKRRKHVPHAQVEGIRAKLEEVRDIRSTVRRALTDMHADLAAVRARPMPDPAPHHEIQAPCAEPEPDEQPLESCVLQPSVMKLIDRLYGGKL